MRQATILGEKRCEKPSACLPKRPATTAATSGARTIHALDLYEKRLTNCATSRSIPIPTPFGSVT